tara:strand:- start:802 stop:1215 length:414 start_codon:yes stop_codon:yes gene_type:complete
MDDYFEMNSSQKLFVSLIRKQRKEIIKKGNYGKLSFDDIKRIDKYLNSNIFCSDECCIYRGELKKNYATISYKGKKVSVHRLLYHNYINNLIKTDYIVFNCPNKGICCNLEHFSMSSKKKFKKKFERKIVKKKETNK